MELFELLLPYSSVSIIGLGKNVGKTTTLNYIVNKFSLLSLSMTLLSIGRDGENIDIVTSTDKPRIFAPSGSIVVTTEVLLPECDITKEILYATNYSTPLGRVIVVRALSNGYVQLSGPSIVSQVNELIGILKKYNSDKIIIDGAISRKSFSNPGVCDICVLCTGASIGSEINSVVNRTVNAVKILTLPQAQYDDNEIHLKGIVSDKIIDSLLMTAKGTSLSEKTIVAEDPNKFFVSAQMLNKLNVLNIKLAVSKPIKLAAITINPISPNGKNLNSNELKASLKASLPFNVFNVLEED